MPNVRCDNCGRGTEMKLQTRKIGREIEEVYFKCDHCDEKYTCYVTDAKARKMQKQLQKEVHPIKKANLKVKMHERMTKLKAELHAK